MRLAHSERRFPRGYDRTPRVGESQRRGLARPERGEEIPDRTVEPDLSDRGCERPLCAAAQTTGQAAQKRAFDRARVPRAEGAGRGRISRPAPAGALRRRGGDRHCLLSHDLHREDRRPIYDAMNEGLARLHSIDVAAAGLSDYGKPGSYLARQYQRWTDQYRASETARVEDMERLIAWLADRVPTDDGRVALVHGDWRIDNMIFDSTSPRLLAVLDWELSTLGHPFADLAYQCMQWRLPNGRYRGLGGVDRAATGIPTEAENVAAYCQRMGLGAIPDWTFFIAFSFFRSIAIHQGVYKRALDGNASNPELARQVGESMPFVAHVAWKGVEEGR